MRENDWLRGFLHDQKALDGPNRQMAQALLAMLDLAESHPNPRAKIPVDVIRQTIVRYFFKDDDD